MVEEVEKMKNGENKSLLTLLPVDDSLNGDLLNADARAKNCKWFQIVLDVCTSQIFLNFSSGRQEK